MTPNRAFLGHEVSLPVDLVLGTDPDVTTDKVTVDDIVEGIVDRMRSEGIFVRQQLGQAATHMKARYDAKLRKSYEFK